MTDQDAGDYEQQVNELVRRMLDTFPQESRLLLARFRGDKAGFEARLWTRWQEGFELFELVLEDATLLGESFNAEHRPQAAANNDYVFDAQVRLHARAVLHASEAYALLRSGFGSGALARWRSIHEVLIVMRLIGEHGAELAQRYLEYHHVTRLHAAEEYQTHAAALGEEPIEQHIMDQLRQPVEYFRNRFEPEFLDI